MSLLYEEVIEMDADKKEEERWIRKNKRWEKIIFYYKKDVSLEKAKRLTEENYGYTKDWVEYGKL